VVKKNEHSRYKFLRRNGSFQALDDESEDARDLFPSHTELFHYFVYAEVFEVFEDCRYGHAGVAKYPGSTASVGTLSTAGHCDQSRGAIRAS
jgi:hypothetical protein